MGSKSDYYENKVLDAALRNASYTGVATVYSALYTTIPSDSTAGTEVTNASSGYTRTASTFVTAGATTAGRTQNSGAVNFPTATANYGDIVGWAVLDTSTVGAGNILYWATITTTAINSGDQATFPVGNIVITED